MTSQPLPSEFPFIWGKFRFLFYQCVLYLEYKQRRLTSAMQAQKALQLALISEAFFFMMRKCRRVLEFSVSLLAFMNSALLAAVSAWLCTFMSSAFVSAKKAWHTDRPSRKSWPDEKTTFTGKFWDEKKDYPAFSRDNLFLTKILTNIAQVQ